MNAATSRGLNIVTPGWRDIWFVILAALLVQILTWSVLYPQVGYNDFTLAAAQLVFMVLGGLFAWRFRLGLRQLGIRGQDLLRAALGVGLVYVLLLVGLVLLNTLNGSTPIFRSEYSLYAWFNNWFLTGFGEELLFAGVLFNLFTRQFHHRKRWLAVLLTAGVFSMWHLPGYLAIGLRMDSLGPGLLVDLILPMISWCFFGMMYLLSGNLWLTAFVHASTDYALLPAITNQPLIGLVFMFMALGVAWWFGKRGRS